MAQPDGAILPRSPETLLTIVGTFTASASRPSGWGEGVVFEVVLIGGSRDSGREFSYSRVRIPGRFKRPIRRTVNGIDPLVPQLWKDQCMLWRVRDFKGIKSADLDVRQGKATVLTGINSSGKSSIIQSLLLAAQSLHSDTQVVLNGPLVRLGDAQDLVREGSKDGAIEITVGLDELVSEEELTQLDLRATFNLAPADERSSLRVRNLKIASSDHDPHPLVVGRENSRATDVALAREATGHLGSRDALHLKSLLGSERRQLRTYVAMQGMRPVAIVQLMKATDLETRYRAVLGSLLDNEDERVWAVSFVREFVQLILRRPSDPTSTRTRILAQKFSRFRNGNPYGFADVWRNLSPRERRVLIDLAVSARGERPWVVLPLRGTSWPAPTMGLLETALLETVGSSYSVLNSLQATLNSLGERVQYLGPLRDEPRVVWNHWNELAHGLPVGTRGEYSAAVLSRFGTTVVPYTSPDLTVKAGTLAKAVNEWLTYLQIGDTVAARSQGKLGVGFDLKVDGQLRDLTSVGVGVSQALPLLVGLLSCPSDSLFIVEQPELHLHPGVQARLADFMITARRDVALIIETHSESFITRIRRRAAEGGIDVERVAITFVEPEGRGSGSVARTLELSEYGDLSEWPEGFLSGAIGDVQAILSANIRRSAVNGD